MRIKIIAIALLFLVTGCLACRHPNSGGQPAANTPADGGGLSVKLHQFTANNNPDSILIYGKAAMERQFDNGQPDSALVTAGILYHSLNNNRANQKELLLFLYGKRQLAEGDTAAVTKLYSLFTNNYPNEHFAETYDAAYIEIAGYFILLQKKFPFLEADLLLGFYQTLGIVYNIAGDLKKAMYYYGNVYKIDLKDTTGYYLPPSTINLSTALMENGQYDSAVHISLHALKGSGISDNYSAGLQIVLSQAYLLKKNIQEALAARNRAITAIRKIGKKTDSLIRLKEMTVKNSLNRAGEAAVMDSLSRVKKKDVKDSLKRVNEMAVVESAIQYYTQNYMHCIAASQQALVMGRLKHAAFRNRSIGKTLLQMGAAYARLNRSDSALWCYHQALYTVAQVDSLQTESLPAEKDVYAENTLMDALDSLAGIWDEQYAQTRNLQFARLALRARKLAFMAERKLLEAFSYDESMKTQLLSSKRRSEMALRNCLALWQAGNHPEWVQQALRVSEYSKAIVLLHSVNRNRQLANIAEDDSTAENLRRSRYEIISLERKLNEAATPEVKEAVKMQLESAGKIYSHREIAVHQQHSGLKRAGIDTAKITLSYIRRNILPPGGCLLEYFAADSGAYMLWVDGSNSGIAFAPAGNLEKVKEYAQLCSREPGPSHTGNLFTQAWACTRAAMPPAIMQSLAAGACKNLVVIPDGVFSFLPFDALTPVANEYLVKHCAVYTGYSLSTLLANKNTDNQSGGMAVFTPFSENGFDGHNRLPFSKEDAIAIKRVRRRAVVVDGKAATIGMFRKLLANNNIIHLATHAAAAGVPLIYFSDSAMYLPELYATRVPARLVVLSGCETGLGALDPNEGPLSLARGFYYAGAGSVVNSLWQINDGATAGLFTTFYNHYSGGNAGAALRQARLKYLEQHGAAAAPYYWAGLVQIGLDQKTAHQSGGWKWLWLSAVGATVLLLLWRIRRRLQPADR